MQHVRITLARWAVAISLLLLAVKMLGWYLSNSAAMLTDALESIVNVAASSFALYSIHYSARPRDLTHPYGHGKVEFFSAGLEGGLILIAGGLMLYEGFHRLGTPVPLTWLGGAVAIALGTGAVNGGLGYILRKRGKELQSLTLQADGEHLLTDAYSSTALALGLGLVWLTGWNWIDAALSIGFSLLLIYKGLALGRQSVSGLMDRANPELVDQVVTVLQQGRRPDWIDVHHLKIQHYGERLHIDCHATLPYYYTLSEAHRELTNMEVLLRRELPYGVELFIHPDPCLPQCCHYCQVANCPVRSEPHRIDLIWDADRLYHNRKHFREEGGKEGPALPGVPTAGV